MKMSNMIVLGLVSVGAAMILLPFIWMLSISVKPHAEVFSTDITLLPKSPTLQNYWHAISQTDIPLYLMNGVIVTGGILAFNFWLLFRLPMRWHIGTSVGAT